jgi:large subunit ribosomal protein L31e
MIREFASKHMKSDDVTLEQELNRSIWSKGKTNPPRKVRVKMTKDEDGVVTVSLYEEAPEQVTETATEPAPTAAAEAPAEKAEEADKKEPAAK